MANEQEFKRFSINSVVDEQALREIYLRPFEMLATCASPPGCFMTSYNCINGLHADMNERLLKKILRKEWEFAGLVMSDWGGTNSTVESILAGCDLEMPGPSLRRGQKLVDLLQGDSDSQLMNAIDDSCSRILSLAKQMNLLGLSREEVRASRNRPETSSTSAADLQTLRKIVGNGHVLLKNDNGVLPLKLDCLRGKKVAFIGPNAATCAPGGGGSASMNPQYQSHPLGAFKSLATASGCDLEVCHAVGTYSHRWLPLAESDQWSSTATAAAEPKTFRVDFFASADCTGPIVQTQYRENSSIDLTDSSPASLRESGTPYSMKVTSYLTPKSSGMHSFSLASVGHSQLFLDGKLLIDNNNWTELGDAFYAFSSVEVRADLELGGGRTYKIVIEASTKIPTLEDAGSAFSWGMQPSTRLGYLEELPTSEAMIAEAVQLANACDYTILVIGLNDEWESEGYDRKGLSLPSHQDQLVQTILNEARTNVVIINQSGSAVEMPWANQAATILQAWYGGQEAGNALADVLLGRTSPSGRLPFTWPRRYHDLSFAEDPVMYPGVNGDVVYGEGTAVGYRGNLRRGVEPQWWFGHGLGYTSFRTVKAKAIDSHDHQGWEIAVEVQNTGSIDDQQVLQIYTWHHGQDQDRQLRSFDKTDRLEPGTSQTLELHLKKRDMARWCDGQWVLEQGKYSIGLGKHAGDMETVVGVVDVPHTLIWNVSP